MLETNHHSNLSVAQSCLMAFIVIVGVILFAPIREVLANSIGTEASTLIYYFLGMGVPFIAIYYIRKTKMKKVIFLFQIHNPRLIPVLIISALSLLLGIIEPISTSIPMSESVRQSLADLSRQKGIYTFILMVIAAPVLEELIFRGLLLDGLLRKYSAIKSILISSLLFGSVHLNPWQFLAGFILGLFIGWIYVETKSLSFSIIIHSAVNLYGYLVRIFTDTNKMMNDSWENVYGELVITLLIIAGSVTIFIISIYYLKRIFSQSVASH